MKGFFDGLTPEQKAAALDYQGPEEIGAFEAFVIGIQKLAEQCGATEPGVPYCDPEAWREAFDDGMTPADAWREECMAAAEMLG